MYAYMGVNACGGQKREGINSPGVEFPEVVSHPV